MIIQNQQLTYTIAQENELSAEEQALVKAAREATDRSYVPYSKFHVGAAALLENGVTVIGSNQENAAYPSGTCAERCAIFYANSQYPDTPVRTLAVAARLENGEFLKAPISPCGSCRQVLIETEHRYGRPMRVLLYGTTGVYILESCSLLLPYQFYAEAMEG